ECPQAAPSTSAVRQYSSSLPQTSTTTHHSPLTTHHSPLTDDSLAHHLGHYPSGDGRPAPVHAGCRPAGRLAGMVCVVRRRAARLSPRKYNQAGGVYAGRGAAGGPRGGRSALSDRSAVAARLAL